METTGSSTLPAGGTTGPFSMSNSGGRTLRTEAHWESISQRSFAQYFLKLNDDGRRSARSSVSSCRRSSTRITPWTFFAGNCNLIGRQNARAVTYTADAATDHQGLVVLGEEILVQTFELDCPAGADTDLRHPCAPDHRRRPRLNCPSTILSIAGGRAHPYRGAWAMSRDGRQAQAPAAPIWVSDVC
jgi:hypothetical protein